MQDQRPGTAFNGMVPNPSLLPNPWYRKKKRNKEKWKKEHQKNIIEN
jgi:hypothetical protein